MRILRYYLEKYHSLLTRVERLEIWSVMGTTKPLIRLALQFLDLLSSLLEILLSILLSALLLPIFAIFYLLNELIRLGISIALLYEYYCTSRNDGLKVELISHGVDGIWSYQKAGNSRNVLIVYVYSSKLDLDSFRYNYLHQIVNSPTYTKLRKIFVKRYGYFAWKLTGSAFNINSHVKYLSESHAANQVIITASQLNREVLPALAADMDESKPQWEEIIIPYFQYDDETVESTSGMKSARIYRSHHAYMDGGSTLMLCANMYTPVPAAVEKQFGGGGGGVGSQDCCSGPVFPYMVNPLAQPKIPAWKTMLYKVHCGLTGLTTVMKILHEASRIRSRFIRPEYSGQHLFSLSKPIALADLKEIKEITHVSLPTILSSVIGTSAQQLDTMMESTSTSTIDIEEESATATATEADKQNSSVSLGLVGAILPYPNHKPTNRFTVVNFKVSTTSASTNLENLKKTQRNMAQLMGSPNGYINYIMFKVFGKAPAGIIQSMMRNGRTPIIYSNTPWASERVQLWGTTVVDVFGWMPLLTTAGIGILTASYADSLKFCVIADRSCLSEKEITLLTDELSTQVDLLLQECRLKRKAANLLCDSKKGALLV